MAELTVDLLLEDASFKRDLDRAVNRAKESGQQIGDGVTKPVGSAFSSIAKIAGGFAIGSLLADIPGQITRAFGASIAAAQKQEDAINKLNSALRRTGEFTRELSEDFQAFASALQSQSTVGDEVILQQLAYAKSLGLSNEQAKEFVTAALNASAALDKDFGSTLQQLIKTLSGIQGELGESVNEIRSLSSEQLKAGEAAKVFNTRFAGAARAELNTYSGSVKSLSNAFGDFTESLGQYITQSGDVNSATKSLSRFFSDLALRIKPNKSVADSVQIIQNQIVELQESIAQSRAVLAKGGFIDAFALKKNITDSGKEIDNLLLKINELRRGGNTGPDAFGPFQESIKEATRVSQQEVDKQVMAIKMLGLTRLEEIKLQEQEQVNALNNARKFNDDRILSEQDYQRRLAEVRTQARAQEDLIAEQRRLKEQERIEQERQDRLNSLATFQNFADASSDVFEQLAKDFRVTSKQVGESLVRGIGVGAGNAFAAFGRAAATGENVLKAFSDALFQSISSQAVALGTNYVLSGTAMLFSPNPKDKAQAPFLIKAGAALAAFGGFLGGSVGGGAGQSTPSAGQGVEGAAFQPDTDLRTDLVTEERLEPETRVQLTIMGDVLDSTESGLRIAKILQDAVQTDNVKVFGGIA